MSSTMLGIYLVNDLLKETADFLEKDIQALDTQIRAKYY